MTTNFAICQNHHLDMKDSLYFSKLHEHAIIPSKQTENAGYDIYSYFEEDRISIEPGEIALISTGIIAAFSSKYSMIIKERGSTGVLGLAVRMGVIDSGFRDEIIVGINNTARKNIFIDKSQSLVKETDDCIYYPYTKAIAQLIMVCIPELRIKEVSREKIVSFKSSRGFGKLGSTGK